MEGLVALFREVSLSIERHLSGAVAWEAFGDEATGTVLIQEVFRREDDADAYEEHMESNGFIARAYVNGPGFDGDSFYWFPIVPLVAV